MIANVNHRRRKEHVMGTRIKIMDLEVDILSEDTLREEVAGYLSLGALNTIHLVSLDYIDTYEANDLVQDTLKEADMVLPGEKAILSTYHVDVLETGGMVVDYRSAGRIADRELLEGRKCYLVLKDQKEARVVYRYLINHYPFLEIVGLYVAGKEVRQEALINDINTKLPDIILISMEDIQAEEWIHSNKIKINARLCVVLSSVMNLIIQENIHVPKFIKKLKLGSIYACIARIPYSNFWRRRIFRKKMDNYNNKKLLEKADVNEELSDEKEGQ